MKWAICILIAATTAMAAAQIPRITLRKQPIRIQVRHADPWAVKTMLEGGQIQSPELSTILALMGGQPPAPGGNGGLFPDGKFMVNPTDNSLWFIPNP